MAAARPCVRCTTTFLEVLTSSRSPWRPQNPIAALPVRQQLRRSLKTVSNDHQPDIPDFAFAFDIDGVLLRSSKALPRAQKALKYLQSQRIPFILLTNGGGKYESERVDELSDRLNVPLDTGMFVQSHTPFAEMVEDSELYGKGLKDSCILVTGGDGDKCRHVAEKYGFLNVVTPGDIITAHPTIWPFAQNFLDYYRSHSRPLPCRINVEDPSASLKIDAVFIYNDPRDWALDTQIILDILLSQNGIVGTYSKLNDNPDLPNRGFQQDGQPPLYFSNPDLLWAAAYHLPRLGQGGFREALEGVWAAVTGGEKMGVKLLKTVIGKPYRETFLFAENKLKRHRSVIMGQEAAKRGLERVYMVGDNPESDIRGGNQFESPAGSEWHSILVRSGVYNGGEPAWKPKAIVDDVWDAVRWGLKSSGWRPPAE